MSGYPGPPLDPASILTDPAAKTLLNNAYAKLSVPRFAVGIGRAERAATLGSVMASPPTVTVGGSDSQGHRPQGPLTARAYPRQERMVTMTPDEADRAITAEIGLWDPQDQAAARQVADLMPRTAHGVELMRALRVDGFVVLADGTIEVTRTKH
jgi:hypothetical protein